MHYKGIKRQIMQSCIFSSCQVEIKKVISKHTFIILVMQSEPVIFLFTNRAANSIHSHYQIRQLFSQLANQSFGP